MLVHNKGKYVRHAAGLMLVPGANQVDAKDFKTFSAHPLMKNLIDKEEIVAQKNLEDMRADEAIELVKDTFSLSLLEEFREGEKRKTVLEAIDAQAEAIQGLGADEDEE